MSLPYKAFVIDAFKKVLDVITAAKVYTETELHAIRKFKKAYEIELDSFLKRYEEIRKEWEQKLQESKEDEEAKKNINQTYTSKINELLNCVSEVKPLDYSKIQKAMQEKIISPDDMNFLEPVLINIPEE